MGSQIDVSQPADGAFASKGALRANLAAAKSELEHGGFFSRGVIGAQERTVALQLAETAYNVREFGATGDGVTDDTAAFDAAIAAINASGRPGTLFVPAPPSGSYRIYSWLIRPAVDIAVVGERSRLKRLDNVTQIPGFTFSKGRMVRVEGNDPDLADALGYYPRVTFIGLVFDGNRQNQVKEDGTPWPIDFSLQHHHAVTVSAANAHPYRQPITCIDCDFYYTTGEGISTSRNAHVRAERCRFYGCFRGGITVVGQHFEVIARDCHSDDPVASEHGMYSGFYMEEEPEGFTQGGFVAIDGWTFRQGHLNVSTWGNVPDEILAPGDRHEYILNRIYVPPENLGRQVHFYNDGQARCLVSNSIFYGGRSDQEQRTAVEGRNVRFVNCTFIASNNGRPFTDPAPPFYAAVRLRDDHSYNEPHQRVQFEACQFLLDETLTDGVPVYAIYKDRPDEDITNLALAPGFLPPTEVFQGCDFGYLKHWPNKDPSQPPVMKKFDWIFFSEKGGLLRFAGCDGHAKNGFKFYAQEGGYGVYLEFAGGVYVVEDKLFAFDSQGEPRVHFVVKFSDFVVEDRYNGLQITDGTASNFGRVSPWGSGRTVMVVSDPTSPGPVQITDRFFYDGRRSGNVYGGRLEGTPVVAGSLTITNQASGAVITDQGDGTLGGAGTGTVDYATGWFRFSWVTIPGANDRIVHSYQHHNQVPGFVGDEAVLKSDPTRRWRCTANHDTAATWVAVP